MKKVNTRVKDSRVSGLGDRQMEHMCKCWTGTRKEILLPWGWRCCTSALCRGRRRQKVKGFQSPCGLQRVGVWGRTGLGLYCLLPHLTGPSGWGLSSATRAGHSQGASPHNTHVRHPAWDSYPITGCLRGRSFRVTALSPFPGMALPVCLFLRKEWGWGGGLEENVDSTEIAEGQRI